MEKTMTKDEALRAIGELKDYVLQLDKQVWKAEDIKSGVRYQHPHTMVPSTIIRVDLNMAGIKKFSRISSQFVMWKEARDLNATDMAAYLNRKKCKKVA